MKVLRLGFVSFLHLLAWPGVGLGALGTGWARACLAAAARVRGAP